MIRSTNRLNPSSSLSPAPLDLGRAVEIRRLSRDSQNLTTDDVMMGEQVEFQDGRGLYQP